MPERRVIVFHDGSVKQVMKTLDRPKESTASGTPLGPDMEVSK